MKPHLKVQIVDLSTVKAAELDDLWQLEVRFWRDRLLWDVSDGIAALRRIMERGGLPGKAVRAGARAVGYARFGVVERLGVISGLFLAPDCGGTGVGEALLQDIVDEIRRRGVSRIESPFVSSDHPWLVPAFEREGFHTYWREFLRLELRQPREPGNHPAMVSLEPWRETHLGNAAGIMHAAYHGGVDAEIHARYRTADGCRVVLEHILNQGSCGPLVAEASGMACHRGTGIGFVVVTEISARQGHLAQVAVLPEYQGRGLGQLLLNYSASRLAERQFDTLSLVVSRSNNRALRIYQAMGFRPVLAFPVFTWEQQP